MAHLASSDQIAIRPFQPGDAPKARRLIEAVWREHFGAHPDPLVRDFIFSRLSDIDSAESVYRDGAILLCAVTGGDVIGTGAIRRLNARECEMTRMFVDQSHRRRGIGGMIAEQLIGFAAGAGYAAIRLSSNRLLTASHRLYERLGFIATPPWEPDGDAHSLYFMLRIDGAGTASRSGHLSLD